MDELEFPMEVLKETDEDDELTLQTESIQNAIDARVIEKFSAYDEERDHKWRIGADEDAVHFLVIEEARALLKRKDEDGFLTHNGDPVTRLTNHDKQMFADSN